MTTGLITGVEALLRWTHTDLGCCRRTVHTACRETGLIVPIGPLVLREAARKHGLRADCGRIDAVNSLAEAVPDEDLLRDRRGAAASGMPPVLLQLEVSLKAMVIETSPGGQSAGRIQSAAFVLRSTISERLFSMS